jgi:hypothetical protein
MQSFNCLAVTLAMGLAVPAYADVTPTSCAGFEPDSSALDVDTFYAKRAVSIVDAGSKGDRDVLQTLVAPTASYEIWRGDATIASRRRGAAGVVEMAAALRANRFQFVIPMPGPVTISPTPHECAWSTSVLFRGGQPSEGVLLRFDFVDGKLVRGTGKTVSISEGDVRLP